MIVDLEVRLVPSNFLLSSTYLRFRRPPASPPQSPPFLGGLEVSGRCAGTLPAVGGFDGKPGPEAFHCMAFGPGFLGGGAVAVGDMTGDGKPEIIAAAGPGGAAAIRVFDAATRDVVRSITAYPA